MDKIISVLFATALFITPTPVTEIGYSKPLRVDITHASFETIETPGLEQKSLIATKTGVENEDSVWDSLAMCESSGNWQINSGNGFYGGLQFSLSSWRSVGGTGYPHEASREEQIKRAEILRETQGWGAWPGCGQKLNLL